MLCWSVLLMVHKRNSKTVVHKLELASGSSAGFVKRQDARPHSRVGNSIAMERGFRVVLSNKLSGAVGAAVPWTTL